MKCMLMFQYPICEMHFATLKVFITGFSDGIHLSFCDKISCNSAECPARLFIKKKKYLTHL